MKFLKQLLLTTMLAALLATPCAAIPIDDCGLTVHTEKTEDIIIITCVVDHRAHIRRLKICGLDAYMRENDWHVPSVDLTGREGNRQIQSYIPRYRSYVIWCTEMSVQDIILHWTHRYLRAPAINYNAIKILLNDQVSTLTVAVDLWGYPSMRLSGDQSFHSNLFTLVDKFVPEVRKDGEQVISSDTPFISRTVAGKIVTVVYDNPGLTVGDTVEVAAGSIGNHLLLSHRTDTQVCAENAPTVESVADPAAPVEVDDDPSDTVPQTDPDEVTPDPNPTGGTTPVPNA